MIPHPVYGALGWLAVENPGERTDETLRELLHTAHQLARARYERRARASDRPERDERRPHARRLRVSSPHSEREQAIEEGAIASQCLPQILGGGLLAVQAVFEVGALAAEQLFQLIKHLSDQRVRASHGTARIVDEFALELIPATVVALCPLRLDSVVRCPTPVSA